MAGDLYLPKSLDAETKLPAIVFVAGTGGTKKGSAARMAPLCVNNGYVFLAFDYAYTTAKVRVPGSGRPNATSLRAELDEKCEKTFYFRFSLLTLDRLATLER